MSSLDDAFQEAHAAHRLGRLAEAERGYVALLARAPDHAAARQFLGVLRMQTGRHGEAVELLRSAAALAPHDVLCLLNLGVALTNTGDPTGADEAFARAAALEPRLAAAHAGRGGVALALGRPRDAVQHYRKAIALEPHSARYLADCANALLDCGNAKEALELARASTVAAPDHAAGYNTLAQALLRLRHPAEALSACASALRLDPTLADAYHTAGCALLDLDRPADAVEPLTRATELGRTASSYDLGVALRLTKRYEDGARWLEKSLTAQPARHYALGALVDALGHACAWERAAPFERRLVEAVEQGALVGEPGQLLATVDSPRLQLAYARTFLQARIGASAPEPRVASGGTERLRIAYVSSDFHAHATAYLAAELFERHDRARFEVTAISLGRGDGSPMRARLERAFDRFVDASAASDDEIAAQLVATGTQVAVDLKGYSAGNRIEIFARRCAPIQVSYLGYPGTTGAEFMDYVIADRRVIPEEDRRWYSERVVYMPGCYQVNDSMRPWQAEPPARRELGLPESAFVFCCFNSVYKIRPHVFRTWLKLLRDVPGSVLWLLLQNDDAVRNLREYAAAHGVDSDRLVFAPRVAHAAHLARQAAADLFLDTLPYNAHTTCSDALWVGLPVLTCVGATFAGRVAASLLDALGMPELITSNFDEYAERALALARNRERLGALRSRILAVRGTSTLFDGERFARHIESAYLTMWARHRSGEPPAAFEVLDR